MVVEITDKGKTDKKLKWWANILLCGIIFLCIGYGVKRVSEASDVVALFNPEVVSSPRAGLMNLDSYTFEWNQLTRQVKADFSLTNNSDTSMRDMLIYCDLQDRSGVHRGSGRWVIYDSISAKSSQNYVVEDKRYISHMVTPDSISCRIIDARTAGVSIASHGSGTNH
jgi:hypothetical protein